MTTHIQIDKGALGAAPAKVICWHSSEIRATTHMFSSCDKKEDIAVHIVGIIDQIYSKLFFIYVVLVFLTARTEQRENADINSSFAIPLPVGCTRSICHSVLKHKIQSCIVVGVVFSLR